MRLRLLSSLLAATALLAGCFGPGEIDRTQPDKVSKKIFQNADGSPKEYFFRQTVIDVPATTGVSFIGEQGDAERVVFDITEDYLYVYRSYGWLGNDGEIDGNQGDAYHRPGTSFYGAPLAAYPISSHFDVKRQYNPATGEQTNVIVEDTQDRAWNDREYFRVDWGRNEIADFGFGFAQVVQSGVGDSIDEDEANTVERPNISADYLDVVTRFHVEPEHVDWTAYGYGKVPLCYLYTGAYKDCKGGTLKVRASFVPVDKLPRYAEDGNVGGASDYVALNYDDLRFQKFGFFRTERFAFNDQYDVIEGSQIKLANRWNLWKDAASCYDADADLPYAACDPKQLRTIVYYLNEDFPTAKDPAVELSKLHAQAMSNGEEWNTLFREAVKASTGWNDEKLGDKRLFTICPNNPVQDGDPAECGEPGLRPQIGDLRYSMYYYVPNYQESSPLGYGPSAADPKTGEIIQGNAFYYGQPAITLAERTLEIIRLELDLKTNEEIMSGSDIRAIHANSVVDNNNIVAAGIGARARALAEQKNLSSKLERLKRQVDNGQARIDRRATRKNAVKTSGIAESLLTDEIREAFAMQTIKDGTNLNEIDATIASGMMDDDFLFDSRAEREIRALMKPTKSCAILAADVFDEGLLGLVRAARINFYNLTDDGYVLQEGRTEADVRAFMIASTMGDTQLHEIGHTVGLRHNFAGSSDALNFGEDYWRERMGVREAGQPRPLPEWDIPATGGARTALLAAIDNGLRDNQDSSVMDYASTYGTTTSLGKYDYAAIKYAYGDMVEVFDNGTDISPARAKLLQQGEVHYSRYPEIVSDAASPEERVADIHKRKDMNFRKVPKLKLATEDDPIEVPYSFCSDEYRDASATCALWDAGADNFERTNYSVQKYRAYRIFNTFKRERLVFGLDVFGYLSRVYSRDFTYMLNQYKNWVNDEAIVRGDRPCLVVTDGQIEEEAADRFTADSCGLAGFVGTVQTVNALSELLASPDVGCYVRLANGCYETAEDNASLGNPVDGAYTFVDANPAACDANTPAVGNANFKVTNNVPYMRVRRSDEIRWYDFENEQPTCESITNVTVVDDVGAAVDGKVQLSRQEDVAGFARSANTLYDREQYGYYFYNKPTVMGSWWEKWLAIKAIGDANTDFIGVDASSDTRSFLINLNTLFGSDLNNLIGSVVTENITGYGAMLTNPNQAPTVIPMLSLTGFGADRNNLPSPTVNPDQQYTFRLLAMYNAAYNGQYTDDYDIAESMMVGLTHSITDNDIPDDVRNDPTRYVEVNDPVSGKKYFALKQFHGGEEDFYSIGFEFLRQIKDRYYVGGADGPGTEFLSQYAEQDFEPRSDLEIAQQMAQTVRSFGYADVWSGELDL